MKQIATLGLIAALANTPRFCMAADTATAGASGTATAEKPAPTAKPGTPAGQPVASANPPGEKPATDKPADGAAPAAAAAARTREPVNSKEILVDTYQQVLQDRLGHRVSKQDAWDIYKAAIAVSAQLSIDKPLSLAGVGRFHVMDSQRSVRVGKPAKRLRFRASSAITKCLNEGGDFLAEMTSAVDDGEDDADAGKDTKAETKAAKPGKAKGGAEKKTPAPAAKTPAATTPGAAAALEDL